MCDKQTNATMLVPECSVVNYIYLVGCPLILLLGTFGNVINFVVMSQAGLCSTASAIFIKVLAVSDTVAIWVGLGRHFISKAFGVNVRDLSPLACQLQRFLLYTSMDASAWLLVALAAERFTAVCLPHAIGQRGLVKARLACAGVALAAAAFNAHVFWTRGAQVVVDAKRNVTLAVNCGYPDPEYAEFWKKYQGWLALVAYSVVPSAIMFALNVCIARKLSALSKTMRLSRKRSLASSASESGDLQQTPPRRAADASRILTTMLLAGTTLFLCIGAPAFLYNSLEAALDLAAASPGYKVADAVVTLLNFANHAANFYVYLATGKGFRSEARKLVLGCGSSAGGGGGAREPLMKLGRKSTVTETD